MLIHIHDNALRRVAFLDNEKPGTLHYYNDSWHRYLTEATSTFDFTVPKSNHEALPFLTDKSYISFRHKHRDYLFSVMRIEETEQELTCFCENLNLELLNESAAKFEAPHAMSFAEYFNDSTQIGGAKYTDLVIGINEVSGYRRQLTWEGTETKLARLLSLVGRFDAECEFDTKLNRDGTLKHIVLNVYKKHDDTHQGVGARRQDVTLFYGKEVRGIRRTIDKTELYSAIQPIGKDGLTIGDLNKQELNDDGRVAFVTYYGDPNIYAPITAEDYPPQFASKDDPWILYRWEYDTDNVNVLYGQALAKLKTLCEPAMTYEVDGHFDLDVGDTVTIHDDKFVPTLLLEARVSEQEVCFSDPSRNKTKFSNFKALESKTSVDIFSRISAILESHKSYRLELSSTDGTVFKNGEGSTTLAASVKDGVKDATATFTIDWYKDGVQVGTGKSLTVAATQIDGKSVIRYDASDADAVLIGSYEVTLTNVQDGEPGPPGEPGTPGEPGEPGEKGNDGVGIAAVTSEYYLSTSKTAQVDGFWSLVMPMWETGKYLWIRTKVTYTDDNVIYTEPYSDSGWEAAQAVDNKLGSYATISDMNTNIQNSEESILATASATYATKADVTLIDGKFLNYSTTIQMNSAINQKANEINQSVSAVQITANNALNTANTNYQKVLSQGQNLITNGTGLMGDNTNFAGFNFTSTDSAGGASGSFYRNHAGASAYIISEEFIPIDTTKNYLFEFYAKQDSTTPANYYSYLAPFDVDKKSIAAPHASYVPNTTTTLTQDLKDGDTVVHFESLANWNVATINPSLKGFIFWNYKNSGGYQYPIGVYSRNSWGSLYTDGSSVDKTANTITLIAPWDKGTFPAGTSVSQRDAGGTYMYGILNEPFPSEWTYYSFIYGPSQESMWLKFWGGAAYAKIGFLWNWNKVSDGTGYVSNIKFGEYYASQVDLNNTNTTANNALNTANAAQTGVTDVNNNLTNNYSTTVQMHSAISQKADSITQSVSETYATKTSLAGLTTRVSTAESKLTPTALTTTISSALGGTDSITTTKFVMDKDGLLIRNGGLTIQNNVGQAVMTTDVDGNLTFRGDFKMSSFQSMTFEDDGDTVSGRMSFLLTGHLGTDGHWYADYGIYTTTDFSLGYNAKRYISFSAGQGSRPMLRIIGREANSNIEAILGSNTTHVYYSKINDIENLYLAGNVSVTGTLNMGMGWATYGGRRVPRFHAGSKVVNANGQDYAALLTLAELRTAFNAPGAAATSMAVFVSNGDGIANNAHAEDATYLNGNWYVTFNKGVQGVRINYLAIYWG